MILEIPCASAGTKDFVFKEGHLAMLAPPIINKKYYLIEFGFLTEKKIKSWDYNYNAYVTAALFEDWLNQKDKLRAGALGFKGGVLAPTQPWIPLLFSLTGGFAKTVLHNQPLLGREDKAAGKKTMFLLEAGLLYRYDKYFAKFSYQLSNVKYFKRHTFLTLGVNY
jgi:hypothetical protein